MNTPSYPKKQISVYPTGYVTRRLHNVRFRSFKIIIKNKKRFETVFMKSRPSAMLLPACLATVINKSNVHVFFFFTFNYDNYFIFVHIKLILNAFGGVKRLSVYTWSGDHVTSCPRWKVVRRATSMMSTRRVFRTRVCRHVRTCRARTRPPSRAHAGPD